MENKNNFIVMQNPDRSRHPANDDALFFGANQVLLDQGLSHKDLSDAADTKTILYSEGLKQKEDTSTQHDPDEFEEPEIDTKVFTEDSSVGILQQEAEQAKRHLRLLHSFANFMYHACRALAFVCGNVIAYFILSDVIAKHPIAMQILIAGSLCSVWGYVFSLYRKPKSE